MDGFWTFTAPLIYFVTKLELLKILISKKRLRPHFARGGGFSPLFPLPTPIRIPDVSDGNANCPL